MIERRTEDTAKSHAALCDYAAMGAGRSLPKLAERYRIGTDPVPSKQVQTLKRWSSEGDWQARVAAYDAALQAEAEADRAALRAQRRRQLEDQDWEQGQALRDQVSAFLEELPLFRDEHISESEIEGTVVRVVHRSLDITLNDIARAMKLASDIQRLSVGEPTEIHKTIERELEALLDTLEQQLTPEEFAKVVAILAGRAGA